MTPSDMCYALLKRFEGCKLVAYQDGGGVWTIGWGHTGPEVHEGLVIDQRTADAFLLKDATHAADAANAAATVPLTQGQFDAFVSLVYNIGPGSARKDGIIRLKSGVPSTFLRKLNAGDMLGASLQILRWDKIGAEASNGLARRRAAERALFLS